MYAGCPILESRKARDPVFAVTTGTISPIGQTATQPHSVELVRSSFPHQVKRAPDQHKGDVGCPPQWQRSIVSRLTSLDRSAGSGLPGKSNRRGTSRLEDRALRVCADSTRAAGLSTVCRTRDCGPWRSTTASEGAQCGAAQRCRRWQQPGRCFGYWQISWRCCACRRMRPRPPQRLHR